MAERLSCRPTHCPIWSNVVKVAPNRLQVPKQQPQTRMLALGVRSKRKARPMGRLLSAKVQPFCAAARSLARSPIAMYKVRSCIFCSSARTSSTEAPSLNICTAVRRSAPGFV